MRRGRPPAQPREPPARSILGDPGARLGIVACGLIGVLTLVLSGIGANPSVRGISISENSFVDVRQVLGVAIEASKAAGVEIWEIARSGSMDVATKGKTKELVTRAD